jgi:hypothetical protein
MKESDIKPAIAQIDAELAVISAQRDELSASARALSAKRAELASLLKVTEMPPSKVRTQVLEAAGIASGEAFGTPGK